MPDTNEPSVRDYVESAAVNRGANSDNDSIVNTAREQADMAKRALVKDPKQISDLDPRDRLRAAIRLAMVEEKRKLSQPKKYEVNDRVEVEPAPPALWTDQAKTHWKDLPTAVRLGALKEQKQYQEAVKPIAELSQRASAITGVVDKYRANLPKGMQEHEAIDKLFFWENAIRQNPVQALTQLAQQYGVTFAGQPQTQQERADSATEQEVADKIAAFSKGKPHFEQVRVSMGQLIAAGLANDLSDAYERACAINKLHAHEGAEAKKRASVSPPTSSPSRHTDVAKPGSGVRSSIKAAVAEVRGKNRA